MFLWMLEEFVYILGRLHEEDRDGCMVLGHELLLLMHIRCCSKRGGGRGLCCTPPHCLSTFYLLAHLDTLECILYGHVQEHHVIGMPSAWVVYDNFLACPDNHHLCLASKAMAKWCNTWWTRHVQRIYIASVQCAPQQYLRQWED